MSGSTVKNIGRNATVMERVNRAKRDTLHNCRVSAFKIACRRQFTYIRIQFLAPMLYIRFALLLIFIGLAGYTMPGYAHSSGHGQLSPRKKKLKATPIPRHDRRRIPVKTYVKKGKRVRAHERWIKVKPD